MATRDWANNTGAGLTKKEIGIKLMKKLEELCPCLERMDKLFCRKENVVCLDQFDASIKSYVIDLTTSPDEPTKDVSDSDLMSGSESDYSAYEVQQRKSAKAQQKPKADELITEDPKIKVESDLEPSFSQVRQGRRKNVKLVKGSPKVKVDSDSTPSTSNVTNRGRKSLKQLQDEEERAELQRKWKFMEECVVLQRNKWEEKKELLNQKEEHNYKLDQEQISVECKKMEQELLLKQKQAEHDAAAREKQAKLESVGKLLMAGKSSADIEVLLKLA
ncbi:hypothetical protein O181_032559 [Austropuccinia psidii MF-1]|uniref:Uncharacterized protein n=1 Tax=Austropuccinia psidii MF-1 TaxID=1389203 RepID=A0A9Q3CXN6_9BASI|nr:hypothetical protein [Austropuccinia psidii MF-1]